MRSLVDLWTTTNSWQVPDGWQQGRGAWGGLVVGQIAAAVQAQARHPMRSIHVTMAQPVLAAEAMLDISLVREGRSTQVFDVVLLQADEVTTRARVVCGKQRSLNTDTPKGGAATPPQPAAGPIPIGPPVAPAFTAHLDFRPHEGFPYSRPVGPEAGWIGMTTSGWVSLGSDCTDELSLPVAAALSDAWWVTAIVGVDPTEVVPMATLDFWASFPEADRLPAEVDWSVGLWHEGRIRSAGGGYLTDERVLRDARGTVLVDSVQLVALGR